VQGDKEEKYQLYVVWRHSGELMERQDASSVCLAVLGMKMRIYIYTPAQCNVMLAPVQVVSR
jgi:hypothetical protein